MSRTRWLWLGASLAALGLLAALVLPREVEESGGKPEQSQPKLSMVLTLDKQVYTGAERVIATVTVTNTGHTPARRVVVDCSPDRGGDDPTDNVITTFLAGYDDQIRLGEEEIGDLGPRQSHTSTLTGVVSQSAYDVGVVAVLCEMNVPGVDYSGAAVVATVTGASNVVSERFTVCENDRYDRPAAGVALTLETGPENYSGQAPLSTVTDADGRFSFPAVPAGMYQLSYELPAGHAHHPDVDPYVQLLVTAGEIHWNGPLALTTTDPATACDSEFD